MKITNNKNLPAPMVAAAMQQREIKPYTYSVTTLLKSTREILLTRRHNDEIEQDVSTMAWALFGTATHAVLEDAAQGNAEVQLKWQTGKYTVTGITDYIDGDTVVDYKTTSVWKFKHGDFDDWREQLATYAFMLNQAGHKITKGRIIAILRDHRKGEARLEKDYPEPIETLEFDLTDLTETEKRVRMKLASLNACEDLPDDMLPFCTDSERWARGGGWAVKKNTAKKALRVLPTKECAEQWLSENKGDYIEYRPPFSAKCHEYCACKDFCNQYRDFISKEQER